MDIQYKYFHKWIEAAESFATKRFDAHPINVIGRDNLVRYVSGSNQNLDSATSSKINSSYNNLVETIDTIDMCLDITKEIDMNIVNISGPDQIIRYLRFIKSRTVDTKSLLIDGLGFDWITANFDKISNFEKDDQIGIYLRYCVHIIEAYDDVIDAIDSRIENVSPSDPLMLDHEVTANSHKLILLHKLGIFEQLYDKHFQHLGSVRFAKLISTLLGIPADKFESFRPSVSDLITEILKPNGPKKVQRESANKTVNAFLTELGVINP